MAGGRTLHVRCTTWEQVEVFHTRKLRRGKLLSMKVPFHSDRGTAVTLHLELPNRAIIAIEGTVIKASPVEPDAKAAKTDVGKTWLEVELVGFNEDVIAQIRRMAAGLAPEPAAAPEPAPVAARAPEPEPEPELTLAPAPEPTPVPARLPEPAVAPEPAILPEPAFAPVPEPAFAPVPEPAFAPVPEPAFAPVPEPAFAPMPEPAPLGPRPRRPSTSHGALPPVSTELPADERAVFQHLTAELRRLRSAAVHEVLGVDRDADAEEIRLGWMTLMRRYHPDLVARRNAPAITHLAEELTILANRAYDRLRVALMAEGRATSVGPALNPPPGWMVGFDDISSSGSSLRAKLAQTLQHGGAPQVEPIPAPVPAVGEGGEAFEVRARAMLGDGDADNAQEVLAAALCVYPRSRPLRSLYYVASAVSALTKGEVMLATSQLETALAHHEACNEAAALLDLLRRPNTPMADDEMRRVFR
jgi:hypothetical protein